MLQLKYGKLIENLKSMGKVAIAFSGGVDSAFLLGAAMEALGEDVLAITIKSQVITNAEMDDLGELTRLLNVKHIILELDVFSIPEFKNNLKERCYFCKKHLFQQIKEAAAKEGFNTVIDGSNADDIGDFRPGMKALEELAIISPLKDCGLTKEDIRQLSKELNLVTHNKPSHACLASRIPYGEEITQEKLRMIERAEDYLRTLGFKQLRVRHHNTIARIELIPEDFYKVFEDGLNIEINNNIKALGFKYVALDLAGFRTGSLNEVI